MWPFSRLRGQRSERGYVLVITAVGLMGFIGVGMLAIDVGMLMTARAQAQNAADAGALAAATSMAFDGTADRSPGSLPVRNAIAAATANPVIGQTVSVTPQDVTFLNDPYGQPNWVRVQVFRAAVRSNAVATLIAGFFGVRSADVTATAIGEAAPANAAIGVRPWTIPDRWVEAQTPPWDVTDTFNAYPKDPSVPPDVYIPPNSPGYAGYDPIRDCGLRLTLKAGTGNNIAPSFYNPIAVPGSSGGDDYELNVADGSTVAMHIGDLMTPEPGNMVGPTQQGVEELIARDPTAYWDEGQNKVVSTMSPSPRIVVIPVYDPYYYNTGKENSRNADLKIVNFLGFFVEAVHGNGDVTGRITPVTGILDASAGPAPAGSFPRVIRLVR
jgi:hypothetical protein